MCPRKSPWMAMLPPWSPVSTCHRHYPGRTHGPVRSCSPMDFCFPRICGGSAPALTVSRPAQRSLSLRPANSPSRLKRPSAPEASAASLPPLLLRLLPGGANQFPGGTPSRCEPAPFTAHTTPNLSTSSEFTRKTVDLAASLPLPGVVICFN